MLEIRSRIALEKKKCVMLKIRLRNTYREKKKAVDLQQGKGIISYYKKHGDFEDKYLRWALHTYQPLNTCEGTSRRCVSRSVLIVYVNQSLCHEKAPTRETEYKATI